jgi:P2-related tail formation protein
MDDKLVIASSLSNNELAKAFSRLVAERWDNWDLSPFMAYLVDTCEVSALSYLADQFDVAGLQGFEVAENEEQQRELIKRSIAFHKFIGTTWAIREACRTVGFPVVIIEEGIASAEPDPDTDWARFRVLVEADIARHITKEHSRKLRLFIEFYKNERSHLVELGFYQRLKDDCMLGSSIESGEVLVIKIQNLASYCSAYSNAYNKLKWENAYSSAYSKDYNVNNPRGRKAYSSAYNPDYNNVIENLLIIEN